MDKQLSPETEAALRDAVREIGTARGLDEEAQEELYAHLEDKALGYLSGDESLSEADAVVLARKHFGMVGMARRSTVRSPIPVWSPAFARIVVILAILDAALGVVFSGLRGSGYVLRGIGLGSLYSDALALSVLLIAFGLCLVFANRTDWTRSGSTGTWHLRVKMRWLVLALGLLMILRWVVPGRLDLFGLPGISRQELPEKLEWLGLAIAVLWAGTWVRCIRQANRSAAPLAACAAMWVVLRLSFDGARSFFGWLSPYHDVGGGMAWMLVPGRLFREPNDFFAISKSLLRILWNSGAAPLAFIVLIIVLYVVQFHLVQAIRMYVRNCRNTQRGMPWVLD
ncbi:MAG: hypothetical protein IT365_00575 [Candidatus Hydrogenedentes bacterium]|nr:hypothetical protein [Candidatus Hydrogenedentota bacterium]